MTHSVVLFLLVWMLVGQALMVHRGAVLRPRRAMPGLVLRAEQDPKPLNNDSPYAGYNYSNYWNDVKDVDPRDNFEYQAPLEDYDLDAGDDEILTELRARRQAQNDVWQSTLFRDTHGGDFVGSYELFVPQRRDGQTGIKRADVGSCTCSIKAGAFNASSGVSIHVAETYSSAAAPGAAPSPDAAGAIESLLQATKGSFLPSEFRTQGGNQIVGCAFTLSQVRTDGLYVAEIGMREGPLRVRVRFAYQRVSSLPLAALTEAEAEEAQYELALQGFVVVREALSGSSPIEMRALFSDAPGLPIYDPQADGEPYVVQLFAPRLTLLYPRALRRDGAACLTVQWEAFAAGSMRYQTDRKFVDLLGGIKASATRPRPKKYPLALPPLIFSLSLALSPPLIPLLYPVTCAAPRPSSSPRSSRRTSTRFQQASSPLQG